LLKAAFLLAQSALSTMLDSDSMARETDPGKVSVIIPAYNAARFIGDAVESVLQQTFRNLDIIVVDDGSTDNTLALLEPYRGRLKILSQANAGPSAARNRGLSAASGEYAYFLDADDLIYPETLASLVSHLSSHPEVDLVAGRWRFFDESTQSQSTLSGIVEIPNTSGVDLFRKMLIETLFPLHAALMRTKCLRKCGGWDESLWCAEDRDLWLRLVQHGCRFDFISAAVARYRRHTSNSTLNANRMEQHMLLFLEKWFGRSAAGDSDRAFLKPYAYGLAWLFLAGQCQAAHLDAQMLRCSQIARNWFEQADPDEQLIHQVLWEVYEKPWERSIHSVLWPKSRTSVAELCWVHGRQALRRRQPRDAFSWFMSLARNHPGHFATKLRRLLAR
jgi:GT2 family glycosyltransferase